MNIFDDHLNLGGTYIQFSPVIVLQICKNKTMLIVNCLIGIVTKEK